MVKGNENNLICHAEKKRMYNEFKTEMGNYIDLPGQGTEKTNNRNTARRFF